MADDWSLQIFPNFFLGEMREINRLSAKKFGIAFFDFAASPAVMFFQISTNQKPSTISCFPQ